MNISSSLRVLCIGTMLSATPAMADSTINCLKGVIDNAACRGMIVRYWQHNEAMERIGREEGVDPALIKALVAYESRYRANAVSPKKATGLTQVMYGTAAQYGVRPHQLYHPETSLRTGARILHNLWRKYQRLDLTLAGYNAGEGAVAKYGNRIPPYRETRNYVRDVTRLYHAFRQVEGGIEGGKVTDNTGSHGANQQKNVTVPAVASHRTPPRALPYSTKKRQSSRRNSNFYQSVVTNR